MTAGTTKIKNINLRDKFHIYLEKLRCAVEAEHLFGPQDPKTADYYKLANTAKLEFVQILSEVEEFIEEQESRC